MVSSCSRNCSMKFEIRTHGFASASQTLAEGVEGSTHFAEVLIRPPDSRQSRSFGLESNAKLQQLQDVAKNPYTTYLDSEIVLSLPVQHKAADSMTGNHEPRSL